MITMHSCFRTGTICLKTRFYMNIYLSEFARRWPLRFWLEHGHRPCSSQCGRSKCKGLAVNALISKLPRGGSNSGWVALSCFSKAQPWEAI